MQSMPFDSAHTYPNFFRRYKWAFRAEYDNFENPVIAQPELHKFIHLCGVISKVNLVLYFATTILITSHRLPIPSHQILLR